MKPLGWIGSAREDLVAFLEEVVTEIGHALYVARCGGKHSSAKPLKGFGSSGVLEIVEDCRGDTYRTVYTLRFAEVIYVLHAFQKKSKPGMRTPRREMEKVRRRLKRAEEEYRSWSGVRR